MPDAGSPGPIRIRWERRAVKELLRLEHGARIRVLRAVETLRDDPLKGEMLHGDWKGLRRLRVGSYRVIYGYDGQELLVTVLRVGHRREAYRRG